MTEKVSQSQIGKSGLIIFDGSCGACSAFIGRKQDFFEKYGFKVAPLQQEWVLKLTGLSEEILLQAIHLYTADGSMLRGVDFFRYFSSKVWWLTPISFLMKLPFLRAIFDRLYEVIAKRRKKISRICGLQSSALYK